MWSISKRDWRLFLGDIMESIEKIESYVSGLSQEDFLEDSKTRDAGMRNRLAHGYFVVDCDIVWDIVARELPVLKERLREIDVGG